MLFPYLTFLTQQNKTVSCEICLFPEFSSFFGFPIWPATSFGVNLISDGCHRLVGFICSLPVLNKLAKLLIWNINSHKNASDKLFYFPQFIFALWSIWYCTISCKGQTNIELNQKTTIFWTRYFKGFRRNNCWRNL